MNRRKFIKSCIAGGLLTATCIVGSKYYFGNSKLLEEQSNEHSDYYVPLTDIHLVEHCNLKCKYCAHFSCIAEEEFLDLRQLKKDIRQLYKICGNRIKGFFLLGGEPLLHPKITEIIKIMRDTFPKCYLEVRTNGLLLNSMNDEFWECLHKYSVTLFHSYYPIYKESDIDKYYEKAEKFNVTTFRTKEEIKNHLTTLFGRINLNFEGTVDYINRFNTCTDKIYSPQLYKGKIYNCYVVQGIKHFNKKFNKNIPVTESDYIDIYKINSIDKIKKFLETPPPFCKYCDYHSEARKWENAQAHDITEWTYAFD
jgi:MoaA/NifB/PqqE/SkfB family radical SAM enzyme